MAARVGVFGWGIVAPKSSNIEAFRENLRSVGSWLSPFDGFGPDNFLVGVPDFDFSDYKSWIDSRFPPRQFHNLTEKMDLPSLYAVGAFIQALGQNPGLESILQELGSRAQVHVGTGLGSVNTLYEATIALERSQQAWNCFWTNPERNSALRAHLLRSKPEGEHDSSLPPSPDTACEQQRQVATADWNAYWMALSPELEKYLDELSAIDGLEIKGNVDAGKSSVLREKSRRYAELQERWEAPEPPWKVSANVIWNLHSTPAAQISILGKITGLAFAPCAACSTFAVALRLGMSAIQSGDAKAVVVGATDPPAHPLTVGAFYSARVLAGDRRVSIPLTRLQGTHVSGGAVVWILGDLDFMKARNFRPLGMEPVAVGVSSDAHHIITPSAEGPKTAIWQALDSAGSTPAEIGTWDFHATATPGDYAEAATFQSIFPSDVLVTARKGTFGHGMSAGGGWELTAQYLGYEEGTLFPTPLAPGELNQAIRQLHENFVFDAGCAAPAKSAGKLSMGIGGINACVISRPFTSGPD